MLHDKKSIDNIFSLSKPYEDGDIISTKIGIVSSFTYMHIYKYTIRYYTNYLYLAISLNVFVLLLRRQTVKKHVKSDHKLCASGKSGSGRHLCFYFYQYYVFGFQIIHDAVLMMLYGVLYNFYFVFIRIQLIAAWWRVAAFYINALNGTQFSWFC